MFGVARADGSGLFPTEGQVGKEARHGKKCYPARVSEPGVDPLGQSGRNRWFVVTFDGAPSDCSGRVDVKVTGVRFG